MTKSLTSFGELTREACISTNEVYRYWLWRSWEKSKPVLIFLMCNPSKADWRRDDATVSKCMAYARLWGYGGLIVLNIFALRSRDPAALYGGVDPVGVHNDRWLRILFAYANREKVQIVAAWSKHGAHLGRGHAVLRIAKRSGVSLCCLAVNADGSPSHPLYLPSNLKPRAYTYEVSNRR